MSTDRYTYRVTWSPEDGEYLGLCAEFPSLSWLGPSTEEALAGIQRTISYIVDDLRTSGESIPKPTAEQTSHETEW